MKDSADLMTLELVENKKTRGRPKSSDLDRASQLREAQKRYRQRVQAEAEKTITEKEALRLRHQNKELQERVKALLRTIENQDQTHKDALDRWGICEKKLADALNQLEMKEIKPNYDDVINIAKKPRTTSKKGTAI